MMADEKVQPDPPEPVEVGTGLGSGRIERRLAAFLALDIKDYSLMMSQDEAAAHRQAGGETPPVFTLAFWSTLAMFALLMAANYLGPLLSETLEAAVCL